jgi:predicted nucleic acid-binding protein
MSAPRAFFDTNVLLYMYGGDPSKRGRALELFREHGAAGSLLLSTQVVQEFYAAGARKLGIPRQELRNAAAALLDCPLIVVGPEHVRLAFKNEDQYGISFWDALIVAAAVYGSADVLYTEDLNDGQRYGAVLVRNPFR